MGDFTHAIREEWQRICDAPRLFALSFILVFSAAVGAAGWLFGERLKSKDDLIGTLEKKLKLEGQNRSPSLPIPATGISGKADPKDAANPRHTVDSPLPKSRRQLIQEHRESILRALGPHAGQLITISFEGDSSEIRDFAGDVIDLFKDAGWFVEQTGDLPRSPLFGVYFGPAEETLRPSLRALVDSFTSGGILMKRSAHTGTGVTVQSDRHVGIAIHRVTAER